MKIPPDDPRLTAFALGELEGAEHASVAAAVAADPALQATVDEINRAAAQLSAALASEPMPAVEPIELPRVHLAAVRSPAHPHVRPRARLWEFPYVAIGSLAAACFAIVFILLRQNEEASRRTAATESKRETVQPAEEREEVPVVVWREETPAAPVIPSDLTAPVAREAAPPVPAPAPPSTEVAVAPAGDPIGSTAPFVEPTPAPTTYALHQVEPAISPPAGGVAHSGRSESSPASRNYAPAPAPTFPGALPADTRTGVAQTAPEARAASPAIATDANHYLDLLGGDTATSERLRTTFRDFGAARYPRKPSPPTTGNAVALANDAPAAPDHPAPAVPTLNDDERRAPEENIKASAPTVRRVPYSEPIITGVGQRDETTRRGTLDRGGRIADLDTQLRELRQADSSLDSPVQDFVRDNAFVAVGNQPASVFPIVIDSSSLVNVRRSVLAGNRPARDSVRIEEMLNHPIWNYAAPPNTDAATPFAATLEVASAPWQPKHRLVRVGLKAREIPVAARPPANLVLLIETADTNQTDSRLALIKESLHVLVSRLAPQDQVALAMHSAAATLLLPTTSASERDTIQAAIAGVQPTGVASGTTGLQLAFDIARAHFIPGGINRVIMVSDGDTRIGRDRRDAAARLIAAQADAGVNFSALGYGVRDIRESTLEYLAHHDRGAIACVDSWRDVQQALTERGVGAFATVARRVKVQVEFNPEQVAAWRLIGYEDRVFLREDFDDESLTAETIGAGHTVTALFEIIAPPPMASAAADGAVDRSVEAEMLSVKVRYTLPGEEIARVQQFALTDGAATFERASADFKFAAAIAGYGMLLRESPHKGTATLADVAAWARSGQGTDADGCRGEFIDLVERTSRIAQ